MSLDSQGKSGENWGFEHGQGKSGIFFCTEKTRFLKNIVGKSYNNVREKRFFFNDGKLREFNERWNFFS